MYFETALKESYIFDESKLIPTQAKAFSQLSSRE